MLTREENELLTGIGPGTPMGGMLRRYWLPACLSSEIAEPDSDPVRVRLLGEDLVAFRDSEGRIGLVKEQCPHRGASLFFGRNEEGGLRCLYHGWKMDVGGNVLEMPCEPADSDFRYKVKQVAYATHEQGGLVWAYMGPPAKQPSFPNFEWTLVPPSHRSIAKVHEAANWVQGLEGGLDSSHIDFLHSGRSVLHKEPYQGPQFDSEDAPFGIRYAATRPLDGQTPLSDIEAQRQIRYDGGSEAWDPGRYKYVRVTNFVAPFYSFIPSLTSRRLMTAFVPIDDENHWYYNVFFDADQPVDNEDQLARRHLAVGPDLNADFSKKRTLQNNYWQDRSAMRAKLSFSGIAGNPHQDIAMLESMGPIYDRTQEHLGVSDSAVIRMRHRLLDSLRNHLQGNDPVGLDPSIDYANLRSYGRVVPVETPWQQIGEVASPFQPVLP